MMADLTIKQVNYLAVGLFDYELLTKEMSYWW